MKKRHRVRRWFKRRILRRPRRRLKAIEERIIFEDSLIGFVTEGKSEGKDGSIAIEDEEQSGHGNSNSSEDETKKRHSSITIQEEHEDLLEARPITFQTLLLEIRYLIYSFNLPQQRRLIHLTGKDEVAPTFVALLETCKQMRVEVTEWFKGIQNYEARFYTTDQYGLLDKSNTHFALTIDEAFRKREICKVEESQGLYVLEPICKCCRKFDKVLLHVDWVMITSMALHFKTQDSCGRRDNMNAIKALTSLGNLRSLDILLGDIGHRWDYSREKWQRGDSGDGLFWIPTSAQSHIALISLDHGPLQFVIKVWIVVLGADHKDRTELLVSYNEGVEGILERGSEFPIADLCSVITLQ